MNNNNNRLKRILCCIGLVGLFLIINACAETHMKSEPPEYFIGFLNRTGQNLNGVSVYFGKEKTAFKGGLVKYGKATEGYITMKIPSEAEVRWIRDEKQHSLIVKLADIIPKDFNDGIIYFIFNSDDSITAKAAFLSDIEARKKIESGLAK